MMKTVYYTRKILNFIARNCELSLDYENKIAEIWFHDQKTDKHYNFYIKFELGLELSQSDGMQLDSGNWETGCKTFRVDYETIKEHALKGKHNLNQELINIIKKHDVAYQNINLKDLI